MAADLPEVAEPRDGRAAVTRRHNVVHVRLRLGLANQHVDLGHLEAGNRNVEIKIERREMLQFDPKDLAIPAGLLGELVVGEDVGALLSIAEMLKTQARYGSQTELLRGFHAAVASDDGPGPVDEDRIVKSESLDARRDLGNLLGTMSSRVAAVGFEGSNGNVLDSEIGRHGSAPKNRVRPFN